MHKSYYIYILLCNDGTYYMGVTNNLEKRLIEHNEGIHTESYTYSRRPVVLKFHERYSDINLAIAWEKKLKKWSKKKKEALIYGDLQLLPDLAKKINWKK